MSPSSERIQPEPKHATRGTPSGARFRNTSYCLDALGSPGPHVVASFACESARGQRKIGALPFSRGRSIPRAGIPQCERRQHKQRTLWKACPFWPLACVPSECHGFSYGVQSVVFPLKKPPSGAVCGSLPCSEARWCSPPRPKIQGTRVVGTRTSKCDPSHLPGAQNALLRIARA